MAGKFPQAAFGSYQMLSPPEALQERSGSDFGGSGTCVRAVLASSLFLDRFLAPKMVPGRPPEPSKSRFSCGLFAKIDIFAFSTPIAKRRAKMSPKGSQNGAQSAPRDPLGG